MSEASSRLQVPERTLERAITALRARSEDSLAPATVAEPWSSTPDCVMKAVRQTVAVDAALVAVFHLAQPRPDEVLAAPGLSGAAVREWLQGGIERDPLIRASLRQGEASDTTVAGTTDHPIGQGRHVVVHAVPESLARRRWWCFLLVRDGQPFTDDETHAGQLLLRQWQTLFHRPDETGMGRLLIGCDDRLILADLATETALPHCPRFVEGLVQMLQPLIRQRWPGRVDAVRHDFAVSLGGCPRWLYATRRPGLQGDGQGCWYLEVRQLEDGDLPTVGVVDDDRVARSIGFLHDHFHESPSLTDVAHAVHMSPFHFHRLFSRMVGVSPKQYLQRKQLQVAKWMLRSTRTPIGDIAAHTGFASHGHFTSTFHRLTGVSPSDYRDRY